LIVFKPLSVETDPKSLASPASVLVEAVSSSSSKDPSRSLS